MLEKGANIDIVAQFDDADSLFREKYIKSEQKHRYEIKKCYFILHCNLLERTVEGRITIIFRECFATIIVNLTNRVFLLYRLLASIYFCKQFCKQVNIERKIRN